MEKVDVRKVRAIEDINGGDLIYITFGAVRKYDYRIDNYIADGVAARNIKKDEKVAYVPNYNTEDILVKNR
jgi:hypothetical protein